MSDKPVLIINGDVVDWDKVELDGKPGRFGSGNRTLSVTRGGVQRVWAIKAIRVYVDDDGVATWATYRARELTNEV